MKRFFPVAPKYYLLICLHHQLSPAIYSFISARKAVVRDITRQQVVQTIHIQVRAIFYVVLLSSNHCQIFLLYTEIMLRLREEEA